MIKGTYRAVGVEIEVWVPLNLVIALVFLQRKI